MDWELSFLSRAYSLRECSDGAADYRRRAVALAFALLGNRLNKEELL